MAHSSATPLGLRISEEAFNKLYPDLVGQYSFFNTPIPYGTSSSYVERVYFRSKLWRLNNMYTVANKFGELVTFKMNYAQHKAYAATRKHSRVIILKSRQQGISTLFLVSFFDDAVWCPHLNIGLMAQGTDEASTLLERAKLLWSELNPAVKAFLNIKLTTDNVVKFAFSNKSVIFIRVSFRSATLQRLHISEFGKIANDNPKRAKETKTGTLQTLKGGNTGVVESTAEGRNDFQKMWDSAVIAEKIGQLAEKDFLPVFLPWTEDPDCVSSVLQVVDSVADKYFASLKVSLTAEQKNFWIMQYRELGADIYQEYPATPEEAFTASRDGTFYARLFNLYVVEKNRLVPNLWDPNLGVEVFIDLGMDDYFVMVFVQWYRGEYRIIDEYVNDGYDITHYIDVAEDRGYSIVNYKFPHDISVRELTATGAGQGKAKTRQQILQEYFKARGIKANIIRVRKDMSQANGIEAVRSMLKSTWIDPKCEYIISCLLNYSKEWNEKLQVFKETDVQNEYCHGADALRAVAQHTVEVQTLHESRYKSTSGHRPRNGGIAL